LVVLNPTNRLGRKEPNMIIIGVDFHPEFQQIALVDTETGEFQEKQLAHPEDAEKFYRALAGRRCALVHAFRSGIKTPYTLEEGGNPFTLGCACTPALPG
jgi:hypothetical protein